jgi:Polyphosphate kinase N-terminal domain
VADAERTAVPSPVREAPAPAVAPRAREASRPAPAREPEVQVAPPAPRFLSAQLSRVEFVRRCLGEVRDRRHPLLHRVWKLGITHQRVDEIFELDVSGLRELREGVQAGPAGLLPDGRTA